MRFRGSWLPADGSVADTLSYTYDDDGNMLTASNQRKPRVPGTVLPKQDQHLRRRRQRSSKRSVPTMADCHPYR